MFEGLTEQEAHEIEIEAISVYGRIDLGTGCLANMTDGGEGASGLIVSDEIREILRQQKLGDKNPMNNPEHRAKVWRIWTDEEKNKLSQSKRNPSAETRARISAAGMGHRRNLGSRRNEEAKEKMRLNNLGEKNPFFGKKHTPETIEKMKEREHPKGMLGKKHTPQAKEKMRQAKLGKTTKSKETIEYEFTDE